MPRRRPAPQLPEASDGTSDRPEMISAHFDQSRKSPARWYYHTYVEPRSGVAFCWAPFVGVDPPSEGELREVLRRHPGAGA